jgi:hypothetical protein
MYLTSWSMAKCFCSSTLWVVSPLWNRTSDSRVLHTFNWKSRITVHYTYSYDKQLTHTAYSIQTVNTRGYAIFISDRDPLYWVIAIEVYTFKNLVWVNYIKVKVRVNLSLCLTKCHAMRTYWGSGGIAPCILDLGTRWRWEVSFTPWPLYPHGKNPQYPFDRRLGGPQSKSGQSGEEKNYQPLPGIEPPSSSL